MKASGLFACLLTKCSIQNQPPVRCLRNIVQVNNLGNKVILKGMTTLGINNDDLFLQLGKTLPDDLSGIMFRWIAIAGNMHLVTKGFDLSESTRPEGISTNDCNLHPLSFKKPGKFRSRCGLS